MTVPLSPADWDRGHRTLAACIGAYFGIRVCQVVVGSVVPGIIETFSVRRGTVGLVLTSMWVVYALVQLPSGILADRVGERAVVVAALGLTATATLGLALAPVFAGVGLAVAAIGGGAGIYYNPATTLLDRSSEGLGQAIGFHRIGAQTAGVVAPAGAAVVALRYGWRETMVFAAVSVVLVTVVFVRGTQPVDPEGGGASLSTLLDTALLRSILGRVHTHTTTFMMTLVEFVGVSTMAFLPTLLLEHHGLSGPSANLLFALYFGVGATFQPFAGWLSDRYGRERTVAVLAGAGVVGYGGLALGGPFVAVGTAVGLTGIAMSCTPVVQSRMLDGLPTAERGAGFGVFRTSYLLLGASGTVVVGTLADRSGWETATGLLSLCFLAIFLVALAAKPTDSA